MGKGIIETTWDKVMYEYGTCSTYNGMNLRKARRDRITNEIQFVLWKAGEHNHTEDYWATYDSSWWKNFKSDKDKKCE